MFRRFGIALAKITAGRTPVAALSGRLSDKRGTVLYVFRFNKIRQIELTRLSHSGSRFPEPC
jgi:hypothetical protein